MTSSHSAGVERAVERREEQQGQPAPSRIVMRYYGWFFSSGILVTGLLLLLLGDDAVAARRVLYTSLALLGFQVLMELLRYINGTFYDGTSASRFRAEVYILTAGALVFLVGGINSPFWLLFVLPIALTAVYSDQKAIFKYAVLTQILLFDLAAVLQAGAAPRAVVQGLVYAAVITALLESTTWSYVLAHFREQQRLQQIQLLNESAQRLIKRRTLDKLVEEALDTALQFARARQGFLLITQQSTGQVLAHQIRGLSLSQGVTPQELANRYRATSLHRSRGVRLVERGAQAVYGRSFHDDDKIESALVLPIATDRGDGSAEGDGSFGGHSDRLATLHLTSPKAGYFKPVSALLEVYASQLATALDNAFYLQEQNETLAHYRSLTELGQKLLAQPDPRLILEQAVHYVRDELPQVAGAYVFLQDDYSPLYALVAQAGPDLGLPAPSAVPLQRLFQNSDFLTEQLVPATCEIDGSRWPAIGVAPPPFGSLLAIQLRVGAKLMGLLLLGGTEPRAFSPIDRVFLGNLAGHVAVAYRNAELHQRLLANRGRLARVLQERTNWRLDQDLGPLLDQMVHSAVRSLGFGAAFIDLYDPRWGGYRTRATANLPEEVEARLRGRLISRDQVTSTLRPEFRVGDSNVYFIPSEYKLADVEWVRYRQSPGISYHGPAQWRPGDIVLVPLRRRDGVQVGILWLDNPEDRARPTTDDGQVLANLADQLVATLEQWRQKDKLGQLSEILASLIEETEAGDLYRFIVEEGARLLESEDCSLFLSYERNTADLERAGAPAGDGMGLAVGGDGEGLVAPVVRFEVAHAPKDAVESREMHISAADGAGLVPYVAATGTSLYFVDEAYKTHRAWDGRYTTGYPPSRGCRSLVLVALRNPGGRITGVLSVENKMGLDAGLGFSQFDREILLPALANAAAMAIERAHFYRRTNEILVQKERDRLAGELHDLGNVFHAGITLRIDKIWEQLPGFRQREASRTLRELEHASRYILGELRKMLEETRHPILVHEGLVEALRRYGEMIGLPGIELSDSIGTRLPVDVEHALYRIAQEALMNAEKHSRAMASNNLQVRVSLHRDGPNTVLEIVDNGPGFDVEKELQKPESFGLIRMQEIAWGIRGDCEISSTPGQGTRVRVTAPIVEKEDTPPLRQQGRVLTGGL